VRNVALSVVVVAFFILGCGGHQSISQTPPVLPQSEGRGMPGAPDVSADDQANSGPLVIVTSKVIITNPGGSAANSASISVNGGVPFVANISPGSPGCTGTVELAS
jgi:hypothetical protein